MCGARLIVASPFIRRCVPKLNTVSIDNKTAAPVNTALNRELQVYILYKTNVIVYNLEKNGLKNMTSLNSENLYPIIRCVCIFLFLILLFEHLVFRPSHTLTPINPCGPIVH